MNSAMGTLSGGSEGRCRLAPCSYLACCDDLVMVMSMRDSCHSPNGSFGTQLGGSKTILLLGAW